MENSINMLDYENMKKDVQLIDFRDEFDCLNDQYGINMLYVRSNPRTRCKCYDKLTGDGDSSCKICGGSGKISTIELTKGIYENIDYTGYANMIELGLSVSNTAIFYLDYKVVPKIKDRLFIAAYKENIPVNIIKSIMIMSVEPIRGDKGRIEAYRCYGRFTPEKIIQDQRRLNSIPYEFKKKIMKGARYSWPQM
jgi:hypothetical protein